MAEETEMEITEVELDEENVAQLLGDEEVQNEQTLEEAGQEQTAPEAASGPRLFIGGLNSKTKDQDLCDHFEKYGTLVECSIAKKKPRVGGQKTKSRGFGFVTMATEAETEAVLKDTHVLNDKIVSVMISKPPDAPERKHRLCVSSLDVEKTTEDTMQAHFSQFGTLTECTVAKEQSEGKTVSRGIGFITMSTDEEVKAVLDASVNSRQTLDGKSVVVKRVVSHTQFYGKDRKLWFGGLDKEKTMESDVIEHFGTFGTVVDCVIIRNPPETEGGECQSKGYGFINMASVAEAGAILKHNKLHKIHGKVLVFNRALQRSTDPDFDHRPVKQIHVSGLKDTPLTADSLKVYFNTHANVKYITMIKEQGAAIITLDKAEDAEKLAHMKDHLIQRHWLTVRKSDPSAAGVKPDKLEKSVPKALRTKPLSKMKGPLLTRDSMGMGRDMGRGMGMGMGRGMALGIGLGRGMGLNMGRVMGRGRGSGNSQTKNRKQQNPRQAQGFGSGGGRGRVGSFNQFYDEPMQDLGDNFGSMMGRFANSDQQLRDTYYDDDPSGYGPVRGGDISSNVPRGRVSGRVRGGGSGGSGGEGTGGWVFVENLYGQPEEKGTYEQQWQKKGFKGKGRGSVLSGSYGDAGGSGGLGGGYSDEWGEGSNMSRGRGWPY